MYTTVEDLLGLEIASQFQVVAGDRGLGKTISWIYVCQENEISPWVQGREIMILYGSGIQRDEDSLVRMVQTCSEKQLSGIIVLLGHFFDTIPERMREEADTLDIPIITMPASIPISIVTREIANLIMEEKRRFRAGGDVLRDMIYGYEDDNRMRELYLAEAGFGPFRHVYIAVLRAQLSPTQRGGLLDIGDIRPLLNEVGTALCTPIVYMQKNRIVALVGTDSDAPIATLTESGERLVDVLERNYGLHHLSFALGSKITGTNHVKASYRDAVAVAKCIPTFWADAKCMSYSHTPSVLKLIFQVQDKNFITSCYEDTIAPVVEYDHTHNSELLLTLWQFLSANCNASKTAELLYVHRNTMNYRLKTIFELLKMDYNNPADRYQLETAMYCYKYDHMQAEQSK